MDIKTLAVKNLRQWPSHWLATLNAFFLLYVLLPVLALLLLVTGYQQMAQGIYWFYSWPWFTSRALGSTKATGCAAA